MSHDITCSTKTEGINGLRQHTAHQQQAIMTRLGVVSSKLLISSLCANNVTSKAEVNRLLSI